MSDYIKFGKILKHYQAPPQVGSLESWDQKALEEVAKEKITEIKKQLIRLIPKAPKLPAESLKDQLALYEVETERYYLFLWLDYWKKFCPNSQKPKQFKDHLTDFDLEKARTYPLEDLFEGKLRFVGGRFVGLCPFHQEFAPSFVIFPDNHFFCFGCHAFGNPIDYLMQLRGLDFKEAVVRLR